MRFVGELRAWQAIDDFNKFATTFWTLFHKTIIPYGPVILQAAVALVKAEALVPMALVPLPLPLVPLS